MVEANPAAADQDGDFQDIIEGGKLILIEKVLRAWSSLLRLKPERTIERAELLTVCMMSR